MLGFLIQVLRIKLGSSCLCPKLLNDLTISAVPSGQRLWAGLLGLVVSVDETLQKVCWREHAGTIHLCLGIKRKKKWNMMSHKPWKGVCPMTWLSPTRPCFLKVQQHTNHAMGLGVRTSEQIGNVQEPRELLELLPVFIFFLFIETRFFCTAKAGLKLAVEFKLVFETKSSSLILPHAGIRSACVCVCINPWPGGYPEHTLQIPSSNRFCL